MEKVTLEKVDELRKRTGISYEKAKEALEACDGDLLDALIYIEKSNYSSETNNDYNQFEENKNAMSIDELKAWFKELIEKGNVSRIKIKKDDTELIDIPVNAGIAAGVIAIIIPPILAAAFIAAIATQITIEITKEDGSVEVVNKYVSKVASDVKNKATDFADKLKTKVNEAKNDSKDESKQKVYTGNETVYSYTVNFDDDDKEINKEEIQESYEEK